MRAKVFGTHTRPRLSVSRSNRYIYAQLIDDSAGCTLIGLHSIKLSAANQSKKGLTKQEKARELGRMFAQHAQERQIAAVVFDRGGSRYQGRIRAFAEGAREGGLVF